MNHHHQKINNKKLSLKETKKNTETKLDETPKDPDLCDLIENLEEKPILKYQSQNTKNIEKNSKKITKNVTQNSEAIFNQMKFLSSCPICKYPFNLFHDEIINHYKSCIKKNNVSIENFYDLAKAQDSLDLLRLKYGLENIDNSDKNQSKKFMKITSEQNDDNIFTKKILKKEKKLFSKFASRSNYALIKRTPEERENILLDKVALILMKSDPKYLGKVYPELTIKSSLLQPLVKRDNLWFLSTSDEFPTKEFYVSSLDFKNETISKDDITTNSENETSLNKQEAPDGFASIENFDQVTRTYQEKLCNDWKNLLFSHKYSDVSLIVEDNRIISSHLCVLHIRCPELLKLKTHDNKIILTNCTFMSIKLLLQFLYSGMLDMKMKLEEKDFTSLNFLITNFSINELKIYTQNYREGDPKENSNNQEKEIFEEHAYLEQTKILDIKNRSEINFETCIQSTPKNDASKKSNSFLKSKLLSNILINSPEINYSNSNEDISTHLKNSKRKISHDLKQLNKKSKQENKELTFISSPIFDNENKQDHSNNLSDDDVVLNATPPKKSQKEIHMISFLEDSNENIPIIDLDISPKTIEDKNEAENKNASKNLKKEKNSQMNKEMETSYLGEIDLTNNMEKEVDNHCLFDSLKINHSSSLPPQNEQNNQIDMSTDLNYEGNYSYNLVEPYNENNEFNLNFSQKNYASSIQQDNEDQNLVKRPEKADNSLIISNMDTPEIKKNLKKFGIKDLKKHQAISLLTHIFNILNSNTLISKNIPEQREQTYNDEQIEQVLGENISPPRVEIKKRQTLENFQTIQSSSKDIPQKVNYTSLINIDKSHDITQMPNYDTLETPLLKKEMNKYGLKNLKRKDAKKLLEHIYNMLHPIVNSEDQINKNDSNQDDYLQINSSPEREQELPEKDDFLSWNSPDIPTETENPLDINKQFFELLKNDKQLHQEILLYSPIVIKRMTSKLKRCNPQKLINFLDKKAITYRLNAKKSRKNQI